MDLRDLLTKGDASIVVVDDLFAGPNLTHIPAEDRHAFIDEIEESPEVKTALERDLGLQAPMASEDLADLACQRATQLWKLYSPDTEARPYLGILFASVQAYAAEVVRLESLVSQLETMFGRAPKRFPSLKDAGEELARSAIAFVDLFIGAEEEIEDVLKHHSGHREHYRERFSHDEKAWPKLVVLMSSMLPRSEHLRSFREETGIRTAFFKAVDKRHLAGGELDELLSSWFVKYEAAALLDSYLNTLTKVVHESSVQVQQDIDQIELHDIAILDVARLLSEGATLHSYMSWLTSELLASRSRVNSAKHASDAPVRVADGAIDTGLLTESVLFDLFSSVTSSPCESGGHPQFGEILVEVGKDQCNPMPVVMALSAACDLARCDVDYEVLLLKGQMTPVGYTAAELLQLGVVFSKDRHLLEYVVEGKKVRGIVEWDKKRSLVTRPAGDLGNVTKYLRLGRMAELFAYEVKEMAVSHLSRIGMPISPSVQRAATVRVRANFVMGKDEPPLKFDLAAPVSTTAMALITRGRLDGEDESEVLMLSTQFRDWFIREIVPKLSMGSENTKIETLLSSLTSWSEWRVILKKNGGSPFKDLSIKILEEDPADQARSLEILVTPI